MQFRQVKNIYFKEMLDTVKDRRTLISMVVIPIFVFPVLMFGLSALIESQVKKMEARAKTIAIYGEENAPGLTALILNQGQFTQLEVNKDSLSEALKTKIIQAAIDFPPHFEKSLSRGDTARVTIYYDRAEIESETALDQLREIIRQFESQIVDVKLKSLNLSREALSPIKIASQNLAAPEKMSGFFLSMFLPYVILILCLTGAMYPAIDLTAGEKERGTLETLLVTPVSRLDIALGKFSAVLTASFVTGILGTASMTVTSLLGFVRLDQNPQAALSFHLNPLSIVMLLILIIPICCLYASLLLSIGLMARSYKEAQSYITPLMFAVIFPAMVSFIPGFEFQTSYSFIPVLNVSLVLKDVLLGTFEWGRIGLVFLINISYAALGIFVAKRMFEKESVLFRI